MSRHVRAGVARDVKRECRKPNPDSKWGSVPDGWELADIVVEVDVEALARAIGDKAMKSKRGISKLQGGAVTVYATNRRRIQA